MDEQAEQSVTVLLTQAGNGSRSAREQLFQLVERELRAIAERQMRDERTDHSLQTTILIDDAFMRLVGDKADVSWQNRKHFYRTAAHAMRRMLIDHERKRRAQRRGGGQQRRVDVDPDFLGTRGRLFDLLALDQALEKLVQIDSQQGHVVELHHFGGLSLKETADVMGVSVTKVKTDWRIAKAWLHRELSHDSADPD